MQDKVVAENMRRFLSENAETAMKELRKNADLPENKQLIQELHSVHSHLKLSGRDYSECHRIIDISASAAAGSTFLLGEGPTIGMDIFVNAGIQAAMLVYLSRYFNSTAKKEGTPKIDPFGTALYMGRELHKAGRITNIGAKLSVCVMGMLAHGAAAVGAPIGGNIAVSATTRKVNAAISFLATEGVGWGFVQARNKGILDLGAQSRETALFATERTFLGSINLIASPESFKRGQEIFSNLPWVLRKSEQAYAVMHKLGADELAGQFIMSYAYHLIDFIVHENKMPSKKDLLGVTRQASISAIIFVLLDKAIQDGLTVVEQKQIQQIERQLLEHPESSEEILIKLKEAKHELEHLKNHFYEETKESTARKDVGMLVSENMGDPTIKIVDMIETFGETIKKQKSGEEIVLPRPEEIPDENVFMDKLIKADKQGGVEARNTKRKLANCLDTLEEKDRIKGFENILNSLKTEEIELENSVKGELIDNIRQIPDKDRAQAFALAIDSFDGGDAHSENKLKLQLYRNRGLLPLFDKDEVIQKLFKSNNGRFPVTEEQVRKVIVSLPNEVADRLEKCKTVEEELEVLKKMIKTVKTSEEQEQVKNTKEIYLKELLINKEKSLKQIQIYKNSLNIMLRSLGYSPERIHNLFEECGKDEDKFREEWIIAHDRSGYDLDKFYKGGELDNSDSIVRKYID